MADTYKPYLIGNARTGLELDMDPWLLPGDAFANLDNFYLFEGRIQKRLGFTPLANVSALPVMGLFNYYTNAGTVDLMAMDTKRMFRLVSGAFVDIAGSDIFTGADNNFFWCTNWLNKMWIANGIDALYSWNGTTLAAVTIAPGGVTVSAPVFVAPYKDRLVILSPTEGGTRAAQRARWCAIGDPTTWPVASWLDAPTQDTILGACFLRDELLVFFDYSIWILRYTGDPALPFIWVRVADNEGAVSPMAIIDFQNEALTFASTRIIGTDGTDTYNIDDKIPRMLLSMNQSSLGYVYSVVNEIDDQVWISYPSIESAKYCDKILVLNFSDGCWNTFSLPFNCFGYYQRAASLLWSDLTMPWTDLWFRWDDKTTQAGYPQLVGGTVAGDVVLLNDGPDDDGTVITADLLSSALNPYVKSGREANLGWVDLLVDRQAASSTFLFELYNDGESAPYLSIPAVPLDDGRNKKKAWLRIPVNCTAGNHQIHITHATEGRMIIHAIIPYFKPGARLNG